MALFRPILFDSKVKNEIPIIQPTQINDPVHDTWVTVNGPEIKCVSSDFKYSKTGFNHPALSPYAKTGMSTVE